jgi:PST family polysaccharide transporter
VVTDSMTASNTLRQAAFKGGMYLAGRQVVSIGLKLIGVMVTTRLLGPAAYGSYVSAFNVYQYILMLGQAGIGVYLLRQQEDVSKAAYGTVYSMMLGMAALIIVIFELGRHQLGAWINVEGFVEVSTVITIALPFQLLAVPATAILERQLNYRAVAMLEITGQICFYAVSIPLVFLGYGPVSLAYGWVAQQAIACLMAFYFSRSLPYLRWDGAIAYDVFRYAMSFAAANWVWQLRMLLNPLIVGPALGAQAVGLVGMAIGLLEMLSTIKTIVWRLSVAVLGKVQDDTAKLLKAVTEGMELQTLAVGAILLGFGWTGSYIVPMLFGARWAPLMDVYPYIAVSYLTISSFNMHSSMMSVIKRNHELGVCFLAHIILFATVAYFAVPKFGMVGYGFGELATLPSYILFHVFVARVIGSPDYRVTALWWVATVIGLFWVQLGVWAIAAPFVALALPISLRRLRKFQAVLLKKAPPAEEASAQ